MITVIIAAGSGTRLWPLSTPNYPKPLLIINGNGRSLLQQTYDRSSNISDKVYVLTADGHSSHIREHLPDLPDDAFIVIPEARGTANDIIAALAYLADRHDPDEAIVILPADHRVNDTDGFAHSFKVAAKISEKTGRIVLVGAEPDYPATGFGYIQKDKLFDEDTYVFNVNSFKEKPKYDDAKQYVKSGNYLWNCGYFVGSLNTFQAKIQKHNPGLLQNFEKLRLSSGEDYINTYLKFEDNAIDYALMEHVDDLLVVPASFDWIDVGSFVDMHVANEQDPDGNTIQGKALTEKLTNSYVHNSTDIPVGVIGLDNVAVVVTEHGIIVTNKNHSQDVGKIAKQFQSDS